MSTDHDWSLAHHGRIQDKSDPANVEVEPNFPDEHAHSATLSLSWREAITRHAGRTARCATVLSLERIGGNRDSVVTGPTPDSASSCSIAAELRCPITPPARSPVETRFRSQPETNLRPGAQRPNLDKGDANRISGTHRLQSGVYPSVRRATEPIPGRLQARRAERHPLPPCGVPKPDHTEGSSRFAGRNPWQTPHADDAEKPRG
jgi:hypothetical protein